MDRGVVSGKGEPRRDPGATPQSAVLRQGSGLWPPVRAPQQQVRAQARGRDGQPLSRLLQAPQGLMLSASWPLFPDFSRMEESPLFFLMFLFIYKGILSISGTFLT